MGLSPVCQAPPGTIPAQPKSSHGVPGLAAPTPYKCFFLIGDHLGPQRAPSPSIPILVSISVACKCLPISGHALYGLTMST